MNADPATIAFYDADAAAYAAWSAREAPRAPLRRFIAAMPAGGSALDLGCGAGWAAAEMAAAGLRVQALDASPGLVAQARARGVDARLGRFEDLSHIAAHDGVWASFSLLHAPRADLPALIARVARALKPGGLLYLGMKEGAGERRDSLGRRYAYVSEEDLREMLAAAGLARVEIERETMRGRDGAPETGLHAFAR